MMKINKRNLLVQVVVSLPIGILIGLRAPDIGLWWTLVYLAILGLASGLLVGTLGFRVREKNDE